MRLLPDSVECVRRGRLPDCQAQGGCCLAFDRTNHALVDGKKCLGWLATTVFLDVNGEPVDLGEDDVFQLVLDVAEGRIGVEEIADRLVTS